MPLNDGWLSQQSENTTANPYSPLGRLSRSSGSLGQIQRVEYNGYIFPPALNCSATITPVYSQTGRHRIGTKIALEVSCFLVDQTASSSERSDPDFQIPSTDANLANARYLLDQNGGLLKFELQGIGLVAVTGSMTVANPSAGILADIDKGPKTQTIEWTPVTPLAAKVKWAVEVTVSDCNSLANKLPFYTDLYATIQTSVDHLGYSTRTISGALVVPVPVDSSALAPTASQAQAAQDILSKKFPSLARFDRAIDSTLSTDGGTLEFVITDTEIRGNAPWFPGTARPEVTYEVGSSLGENEGNFGMWGASLSGTIPVMNGVSKIYGYLAAVTLIEWYLLKASNGTIPAGAENDNYSGANQGYAILTHLSFGEDVYGEDVTFSARWDVATDFSTLLQATGLFVPATPVFPPITLNDGTEEDEISEDVDANTPVNFPRSGNMNRYLQNPNTIHNFIYTGSNLPQITLCSPQEVTAAPALTELSYPGLPAPTGEKLSSPDPTKTYLYVNYEVKIHENNQTFTHSYLTDQPVGLNDTPAGAGVTNRMLTTANPGSFAPFSSVSEATGTSSIPRQVLRKMGRARYLVEVTGMIIRAAFPATVPFISKIGNQNAYKIGRATTVTKIIGRGTTTTDASKPFALYGTSFHQLFAVDEIPNNLSLRGSDNNPVFNSQVDA